jgi:hypothetical protein
MMDDGRAGVCLFPTYIYVSKTLTNDENDDDLQQQHVMDDVGGGELGSGSWRHSRDLCSARHGRRYHVLLAYVKAANYSELVCESPMLLCDERIVNFWSFSGGGAVLSRELKLGSGSASNDDGKVNEDVLEVG